MIAEPSGALDRERPPLTIFIAIAALAGTFADYATTGWTSSRWLVFAWLALAGVVGLGLLRVRSRPLALLAAFAIGGCWHHYRFFDVDNTDLAAQLWETLDRNSQRIQVRGIVGDLPIIRDSGFSGSESTWTLLRLTQARDVFPPDSGWRTATGWVQARIRGRLDSLQMGEPIEATGTVSWIAPPLNPGEFDESEYLQAQGIRLRLEIGSAGDLRLDPQGERSFWLTWLGRARSTSHDRLTAYLSKETAPLAAALLLGRRDEIDPKVFDEYFRTGTLHLLAISGLHFQALAAAIGFAMRCSGWSRRRIEGTIGPLLLGYAVLVGGMPSVVRSCAMATVLTASLIRHRQSRPSGSLATAVIVTLLLNPAHFRNAGCNLSFIAVAAIFWGGHPFWTWMMARLPKIDRIEGHFNAIARSRRKLQTYLEASLLVSAVVWLATLPLTSYCFHQVSPIGILLNVPLVPLSSLALLAAGITLILAIIWPPLALPAAWICHASLWLLQRIVRLGANVPWGNAYVPDPPVWWLIGCAAVFVVLATSRGRSARLGLGLLLPSWLALGLAAISQPIRPERPEAEVLAVGHGSAVILQDSDGRTALYDCGQQGSRSAGRRIIAPALWSRRVSRLEFVVLSHADSDHYNGLEDLLPRFRIGAVLVPPGFPGTNNPGASQLMERVRAEGIPIFEIAAGDGVQLGRGLHLTAAHPPLDWRGVEDNDGSLTFVVDGLGGGRMLMPGDLVGLGLFAVRVQDLGPFDVLVSPHHGGGTANPSWILDPSFAQEVIVSQSARDSRFANDPIRRYADGRARRTWEQGAIRAVWTEKGIALQGFLLMNHSFAVALPHISTIAIWALAISLGLAVAAIIAIIEWGAWTLVRPRPNAGLNRKSAAGADLPPDDAADWEPVRMTARDGVRLAGDWRSREAQPSRVLVLIHGFGEARASMRPRGGPPARDGWGVLAIDLRAFGESEGNRFAFGGREAADVRQWLDWIAERAAPGARIVLWGRSMGAAIAMRAASEDDRAAGLILEAPYLTLKQSLARWLVLARLPRRLNLAPAILFRAKMRAGAALDRPSPKELAAQIRVPVWIFHGQEDGLVPIEHARWIAQTIGDRATLTEIPQARHGNVFSVGGPALEEQALEFLRRCAAVKR